MRINDPGLRSVSQQMLADNKIDHQEAVNLCRTTADGPGLSATERADLERILATAQQTSPARSQLRRFLGYQAQPATADTPQKGYGPMHLLMAAMAGTNPVKINAEDCQRIFAAAQQGGATEVEQQTLISVLRDHGSSWPPAVRQRWQRGLSALRRPETATLRLKGGAAAPEDLSSRIESMWMQGYGFPEQRVFVADLLSLAQQHQFKILLQLEDHIPFEEVLFDLQEKTGMGLPQLDKHLDIVQCGGQFTVWSEDNKILTAGDDRGTPVQVLVPPSISENCYQAALAYTADEAYHPLTPGSFHGAVALRDEQEATKSLVKTLKRQSRQAKCYLEGGNVLAASTVDGSPYCIVGRDSLTISALHLRETDHFDKATVDDKIAEMQAAGQLTAAAVNKTARKLSLVEDFVRGDVGVDYLKHPRKYRPKEPEAYQQNSAKRFMAITELTKQVMAKDLGVPEQRLVFIDQPDFHIDMHLRPLGPGEVLVHHPKQALELLQKALRDPRATTWQRQELRQMQRTARRELKEFGPIYDRIIKQLRAAGLLVVQAPGVFASNKRQANFMNAVPATSKTGKALYLTIGSTIRPLQRAFEQFVKKQGVDQAHFVANSGGGKSRLSAGEISLGIQGGLDCREVDHSGVQTDEQDVIKTLYS